MKKTVFALRICAATIAHHPNRLMLARDVRYTENGVELRLGDGMWGTLSARGKYNLYVSDPEAGQAGFYGTVSENGGMNTITLRVKVFEALIGEIEAVVVRPSGMMSTPGQSNGGWSSPSDFSIIMRPSGNIPFRAAP